MFGFFKRRKLRKQLNEAYEKRYGKEAKIARNAWKLKQALIKLSFEDTAANRHVVEFYQRYLANHGITGIDSVGDCDKLIEELSSVEH